ncbi:MAG TPA: hypothetical protein VGN97_10955 [Mesorhizobium sp.]|jgi:hypothetical protein|nr:hypothetical protein [Mesorhizobium sp.]
MSRPSLAAEKASLVERHTSVEARQEYGEHLKTVTLDGLTRLERIALGHHLTRSRPGKPFSRAERRMSEINRLIAHRHSGTIPEHDDPCDGYVFAMAHLIHAELDDPADQLDVFTQWLETVAPWADANALALKVLASMHPRRKHMRDRAAGRAVRLLFTEREALGISTLSPADMTPGEFRQWQKQSKRRADRERAARRRRAAGAKRQAESVESAAPWKALGISRATYYRHRETVSSPACETVSSPLVESGLDATKLSQRAQASSLEALACDADGGEPRPAQGGVEQQRGMGRARAREARRACALHQEARVQTGDQPMKQLDLFGHEPPALGRFAVRHRR